MNPTFQRRLDEIAKLFGDHPQRGFVVDFPVGDGQLEKLQTVPISVTALSAQSLKEHSVDNLQSLGNTVPSITAYAETRYEESIIIRSQSGSGASAQGQEPTVTEYFAQVPFPVGDGAGPGRYFDGPENFLSI